MLSRSIVRGFEWFGISDRKIGWRNQQKNTPRESTLNRWWGRHFVLRKGLGLCMSMSKSTLQHQHAQIDINLDNAHTANWCTQPPFELSEIKYQMECLTTNPCNQTSDDTVTHNNPRLRDNIDQKVAHCEQVSPILYERPNRHCVRYVHSVEAQIWTFQIYLTKFQDAIMCVSAEQIFDTCCTLRSSAPVEWGTCGFEFGQCRREVLSCRGTSVKVGLWFVVLFVHRCICYHIVWQTLIGGRGLGCLARLHYKVSNMLQCILYA